MLSDCFLRTETVRSIVIFMVLIAGMVVLLSCATKQSPGNAIIIDYKRTTISTKGNPEIRAGEVTYGSLELEVKGIRTNMTSGVVSSPAAGILDDLRNNRLSFLDQAEIIKLLKSKKMIIGGVVIRR